MTENDTDIDFDFFEDEPPTEESSRTERLIPRRTPRGPQEPPRAPTNLTPLLRLIGLIAFAILIVVLLVVWVQSCQATGKDKAYKDYLGKVSDVSSSSQQIGKQLSQVLLEQGLKESQVEQRVSGLAHQEQLDVQRAQAITPPGTLRDEHQALIQALQYRVSGLNGLASALAATANTKDATRAGTVLAGQMQRLLASDVIYQDSFKAPSAAELARQGVTGTNASGGPLIPDSNFLQSSDLVTPAAMVTVVSRIRGSTSTPTAGGLRGTNLVKVVVQPTGTELSTSTQTTVVVRTNMSIDVTVQDSGDSQEANIPVTLRIIQSGVPTVTKRATIGFINPGEQKTVSFTNFPAPSFQNPAQIKVEVQPVQGETNSSNNSADYSVIFSVA
ncbi:MAG TPA: CARDB domain-containing protein [Gaiellaceae bacterium]|nr:CARDB domain-containing protein [Gaiellaceae bacterium]